MRTVVTEIFGQTIQPVLINCARIAVVGGGKDEPELHFFKRSEHKITFLGVEKPLNTSDEEWSYLDLNSSTISLVDRFDLIICNQVLEHIWDIKNAVHVLCSLVDDGGFLWLNFPTSNFAHGSPEYFSAGYHPEIVVKLLPDSMRIIRIGFLGSKRYYRWIHSRFEWPEPDQLAHPVRFLLAQDTSVLRRLWRIIRFIPSLNLALISNRISHTDMMIATESYVFSQKHGAQTEPFR